MVGDDRFERIGSDEWKTAVRPERAEAAPKQDQAREEILIFLADGQWQPITAIRAAMKHEGIGESNTKAALRTLVVEGAVEMRQEARNKAFYRLKPEDDDKIIRMPYADEKDWK